MNANDNHQGTRKDSRDDVPPTVSARDPPRDHSFGSGSPMARDIERVHTSNEPAEQFSGNAGEEYKDPTTAPAGENNEGNRRLPTFSRIRYGMAQALQDQHLTERAQEDSARRARALQAEKTYSEQNYEQWMPANNRQDLPQPGQLPPPAGHRPRPPVMQPLRWPADDVAQQLRDAATDLRSNEDTQQAKTAARGLEALASGTHPTYAQDVAMRARGFNWSRNTDGTWQWSRS